MYANSLQTVSADQCLMSHCSSENLLISSLKTKISPIRIWVAHMAYGAPNVYGTPIRVWGTYIAPNAYGLSCTRMGHPILEWGKIHVWSVTKMPVRDSITSLLSSLMWATLLLHRDCTCLTLLYKIINNILQIPTDYLQTGPTPSTITSTRSSNDLHYQTIPFIRY